jgi:hypothetical protein
VHVHVNGTMHAVGPKGARSIHNLQLRGRTKDKSDPSHKVLLMQKHNHQTRLPHTPTTSTLLCHQLSTSQHVTACATRCEPAPPHHTQMSTGVTWYNAVGPRALHFSSDVSRPRRVRHLLHADQARHTQAPSPDAVATSSRSTSTHTNHGPSAPAHSQTHALDPSPSPSTNHTGADSHALYAVWTHQLQVSAAGLSRYLAMVQGQGDIYD